MIYVEYDRKKNNIKVKGHAQSGDAGHDLVCAATTIIVYTLASNVAQLSSDKSKVRRPIINLGEGKAEIGCSPVHGMTAVVTLILDCICQGFDILAKQYPDNISYIVRG